MLFGRVEIGRDRAAVVDQDVGLQRADEIDDALAALGVEALAHVEPERRERPVVMDQLRNLLAKVLLVAIEVGMRLFGAPAGAAEGEVGVMPVADGIVGAEGDALLAARGGELLDHVAAERRVHDVEIGLLRVEHAKAVVVLGGEDDVFHAGVFGDFDPLVGVELHRVESLVEVIVFLDGTCALRDQPISVPLRLTGPQWTNIPKRAARHQASRASFAALAGLFSAGAAMARAAILRNSARKHAGILMVVFMVELLRLLVV